eukprot:5648902-Pyramimonas_sp.AAC.1
MFPPDPCSPPTSLPSFLGLRQRRMADGEGVPPWGGTIAEGGHRGFRIKSDSGTRSRAVRKK